eukprot:364915-Chlamydomonas_euryale.AAC.35
MPPHGPQPFRVPLPDLGAAWPCPCPWWPCCGEDWYAPVWSDAIAACRTAARCACCAPQTMASIAGA